MRKFHVNFVSHAYEPKQVEIFLKSSQQRLGNYL